MVATLRADDAILRADETRLRARDVRVPLRVTLRPPASALAVEVLHGRDRVARARLELRVLPRASEGKDDGERR